MRPSLSDGLLESLEDTLTESMLSPELPVGGERGISRTGELAALLSVPRNSLERRGSQLLDNEIKRNPVLEHESVCDRKLFFPIIHLKLDPPPSGSINIYLLDVLTG